MTPQSPITKAHLQDQRVVRRRGRPSKFGHGMCKLELPISDAVCLALECLAQNQVWAPLPRTNRQSSKAIEYASDALEQAVWDRFDQVFGLSINDLISMFTGKK